MLGYRAFAREVYTKKAAASLGQVRRDTDKGRPFSEQHQIQALNFLYEIGLEAGLRDNDHHKSKYDDVLMGSKFNEVFSYVIELENPPEVMCSGGIFPEQDFDGQTLQDISDVTATSDLLTFTSFFGGTHGAIVFTWLAESDGTCNRFIDSLHRISDEEVTNALIRFFFEHCENVHMKPEWWENLPQLARDALVRRMTASARPDSGRRDAILVDDGIKFSPWNVIRRQGVGYEI